MENLNLTIIILTNRHDERFVNALQSAQFAAEVLVVDYISGNDWFLLAKKNNFTVIKEIKTITNFAKARNLALKKAKFDWMLFLDSDEIINASSINQIKKIINQNNADGYYINRVDYFLEKKMNWGEVLNQQIIRLVKKDQTKFTRTVHEIAVVNGKVNKSKIKINHHAHLSIRDFFKSIINYAYLEANYRNRIQNLRIKKKDLGNKIQELKIVLEMLFYPFGKFINNYYIKLGLLDGWRGLIYAVMMSLHSLMVRIFLLEKYQEKKQ